MQEIPRDERKRQYAALRRAILKNANPALTAKFSLCDDGERQALSENPAWCAFRSAAASGHCPGRFGMLKTFMINQGVAAIEVEERYERFVRELRTDKYVTAWFLAWRSSV